MIHDYEFDLTWADPPPLWVENVGPLMDVWGNPIFQRRYVLWRLAPSLGAFKAFVVGLLFSLVLNAFLLFVTEKEEAAGLGFLVTVAIPGGLAVTFTGVRLFVSCMVATPREFRTELAADMLGPILTTPMSDSKVYFAECLSGLMRGLGAIEEVVALLVGLLLPYLLLMSPVLLPYALDAGIESLWWIVLFGMFLLAIILLLVLSTLAAGLYAIMLPVAATVPVAMFHVLVIWLGTSFVGFWAVGVVSRFVRLLGSEPLVYLLTATTLEILSLALFTVLTGHLGVLAFARARRPGYYEPERATAAGLFLRERSPETRTYYRMSQRI